MAGAGAGAGAEKKISPPQSWFLEFSARCMRSPGVDPRFEDLAQALNRYDRSLLVLS